MQANSADNVFKTETLSDGQIVTVMGFNIKGCSTLSSVHDFTVNPNPASFFSGLEAEYCINDGGITLTGIPSGGIFSGNGIKGDVFIPEFAGNGSHLIKYTTTSLAGCDSTYIISVLVKNSPSANFTFNNVCDGIAMVFQDTSTPPEEITAWEWDFGDGSVFAVDQHPSHKFQLYEIIPELDLFVKVVLAPSHNC